MSVLIRFTPTGMTMAQYEETVEKVKAGGQWPPDGMDYHVCFGNDGDLKVSEIWDSEEQIQAFGERLMPILEEAGINMAAEPEIIPIHNIERR